MYLRLDVPIAIIIIIIIINTIMFENGYVVHHHDSGVGLGRGGLSGSYCK